MFAIAQATGLTTNFSNHDPVVSSWLFGLFYRLGRDILGAPTRGICMLVVIQCSVLAIECSMCLLYLRSQGAPGVVCGACGLLIALLPVCPLLALFASKDTLYTLVLLPFMLLYLEAVRTRGGLLDRPANLYALVLLSLALMLLKKTGFIICLPCLGMLVWCATNQRRRTIEALALVLAGILAWNCAVLPMLGVQKGHIREALSLPLQQIARVVTYAPEALSERDWQAIDTYFGDPVTEGFPDELYSQQRVAYLYNPTLADPVKENVNNQALENNKRGFMRLWLSLGMARPDVYIQAFADLYRPFFNPACSMYGYPDLFNSYLDDQRFYRHYPYYATLRNFQWQPGFGADDMQLFAQTFNFDSNPLAQRRLMSAFQTLDDFVPTRILIWGSFIPVWVTLAVTAFFAIVAPRQLKWFVLASALPWMLSLAIVLIGPVVWIRYFEPLYFALPLLLAWGFGVLPHRSTRGKHSYNPDEYSIRERTAA